MDATAADIATYGTRSRNRTGTMRPNYAEDQEMDFEMTSTATANSKKKAANESAMTATSSTTDETKRVQNSMSSVAVDGVSGGSPLPGVKDSTPTAALPPTKKRKAPTQSNQTSLASAPLATRKAGTSTAASQASRETNVMTFTKHRNNLNKRGELVADDGSKLCVNGKHSPSPDDDGAGRSCSLFTPLNNHITMHNSD